MPSLKVITPAEFAGKSWQEPNDYRFAQHDNVIPVVAAEVARLVSLMPLAFVEANGRFHLVAVASLQQGANYFVTPDGRWMGHYVPVEFRCYPFRLMAQSAEAEESVLCFDVDSGLLNEAGQGETFFDQAGEPSQALKNVLGFLSEVEENRAGTRAMVDTLAAAKLLKPWELTLNTPEGSREVKGLHCIDEAALNALPDDSWQPLRKSGAVGLAYAQILSMHQLPMLQAAINVHANWSEQASPDFSASDNLAFQLDK